MEGGFGLPSQGLEPSLIGRSIHKRMGRVSAPAMGERSSFGDGRFRFRLSAALAQRRRLAAASWAAAFGVRSLLAAALITASTSGSLLGLATVSRDRMVRSIKPPFSPTKERTVSWVGRLARRTRNSLRCSTGSPWCGGWKPSSFDADAIRAGGAVGDDQGSLASRFAEPLQRRSLIIETSQLLPNRDLPRHPLPWTREPVGGGRKEQESRI